MHNSRSTRPTAVQRIHTVVKLNEHYALCFNEQHQYKASISCHDVILKQWPIIMCTMRNSFVHVARNLKIKMCQ